MTFDLTSKVHVERDDQGVVRQLSHPMQPYGASQTPALEAAADVSPRTLADAYVRDVLPTLSLEPEMADALDAAIATDVVRANEGPKLRHLEEKVAKGQATVSYAQTTLGLEVWEAGLSVRMRGAPYQVVGAQNSIHYGLDVTPPPPDAPYLGDRIDAEALARLLGLGPDAARPTIEGTRLLIYAYDPDNRGNGAGSSDPADASSMDVGFPTITLPPLPDMLEKGRHYVVTEVLFKFAAPGWEPLNWSAFVEPVSGAVLYLRVFVACVDGLVLLRDPITASGDTTTTPASATQVLDSLRSSVELAGLDPPGSVQRLRGEYVELVDVSPPPTQAPTQAPGGRFDYSFPTDDFAAVNAYYHCDSCFRTLAGLGFDVAEFFPAPGTTFPVRVDHRATIDPFGGPNQINASAPGTGGGLGSDGFRFALLAPGSTAGMAVEARVTWHEFGHAVLYGHLRSPNFRFAHSIGDTLAAIVFDPTSQAPGERRGRTFPWTIITRRHDHAPSSGFAWGGTQDATQPVGAFGPDRAGYQREQILSSSLFRLYRSLGGSHADLAVREFASRLTLYLIFDTIRSLSFVAPPRGAADFADALIEADLLMAPFEGHPAGTAHKVVRWAFEQQGLYQAPGAPQPVAAPGVPPEVDVYADDGRGGGYQEAQSFPSEAPDVWCRRSNDGSSGHEAPLFGADNFVYARVRNRGSQPANGAVVRVFASRHASDRTWPNQWQLLAPGPIALQQPLPPGGVETVGPFEWSPEVTGTAGLLAEVDCPDDPSNASNTVQGPIDALWLAHLDNNLAVREVVVEPLVA